MSIAETYQPNTNIYKYNIYMKYILGEEDYNIDSMNIKSIAIDNDYKNNHMPMIFATIALDKKLIDLMVQNQDTGYVVLTIQRAIANSDMPDLYVDYINDKFIYFITEDLNKNEEMDYADSNSDRNDIFKVTSIGLLSMDHVNKNKKAINGVVNGKFSSVLYYVTSHLPILIEPPNENIMITNRFLPPMNSTSKMIEYLNSLNTLYTTPYRFFIDFDCAYLISSSGNIVEKEGEDISTVYFVIRKTYDEASKLQGMIIDTEQNLYQIECDSIDCELADNHATDKSFSKISATSTSGSNTAANLSNRTEDSTIVQKTKSIRVSNDNTGLLDNMVAASDTGAIQLLIQKTDIDSSVLTMNKEYIVNAEDMYGHKDYNGKYILTRKRELYIREDENFIMNTMLLLEKIPEQYINLPKVRSKKINRDGD